MKIPGTATSGRYLCIKRGCPEISGKEKSRDGDTVSFRPSESVIDQSNVIPYSFITGYAYTKTPGGSTVSVTFF